MVQTGSVRGVASCGSVRCLCCVRFCLFVRVFLSVLSYVLFRFVFGWYVWFACDFLIFTVSL
jgi:hypothetical protein